MLARNLELVGKLINTYNTVYYSHNMMIKNNLYIVPIDHNHKVMDEDNFEQILTSLYMAVIPFTDLVIAVWKDPEGNTLGNIAYTYTNTEEAIQKAMQIGHRYIYINELRIALPKAQTSGTGHQQKAYIDQTAEKLSKKLAQVI